MIVVLPSLLSRDAAEGSEKVHGEISARLLELAATNQATFKEVVAGLSAEQKTLFEEIVRFGQKLAAKPEEVVVTGQPKIELKMNFGA